MSATIDDVARRANVSVATVSRAMRGLPNVAPSTRQRVLLAAEELDYVADPSASRLAGGRSRTVGLVVPMLGQWFYSRIFSGVEAVMASAGYDVLPFTLSGPGGPQRFVAALPFRKRVDGLVLVDTTFPPGQLEQVLAAAPCAVTVGVRSPAAPSLTVDNQAAARLAVDHLIALGHTRIALIGGAADDPFHFLPPVERAAGYRESLVAAGIGQDPTLVVAGNFSLEGGAEAMQHLLDLTDPPTAVFACSDEMAIGAMQTARDAGRHVPDKLSIVGFDDHEVSAYVGLTTIGQDVSGQGERAAQLLLEMLAAPADVRDRPVSHLVAPTRLIVRGTTAPPPNTRGSRRRRRTPRAAPGAGSRPDP
jgi:LacI family transcriptional regulator, repressor for deo operon, udp, cdd, tsx, nupC, and nupG